MPCIIWITAHSSLIYAAALQISPTRITLTAKNPINFFTLRNEGDMPVLIQLNPLAWSQENGKDIFTSTKHILITPPVASINPGKSQIIRLGLRHKNHAVDEQAFRIIVEEVPLLLQKKSLGVRILLNLSVPVFIKPIKDQQHHLAWQVQKMGKNKLKLHLFNDSNRHIQLVHLTIASKHTLVNQPIFAYLLPHQVKTWTYKLHEPIGKNLFITAVTDEGKISANKVVKS